METQEKTDLATYLEGLGLSMTDRTYAQMTEREFGDELGWNSDTHASHRLLKSLNARYERLIGSETLLNEIYEKVSA